MLFDLPGRLTDRAIFQPTHDVGIRSEDLRVPVASVFLETEDGVKIHAYYLPVSGASRAILFLHGNAGNASHRLPNALELSRRRANVLLLDYRGYGFSEGVPSELGAYADARAALAHLIHERGIPEHRVVLFGRSLGGAVAVELAQERALAGVILESTFSSASDVVHEILPPPFSWLAGALTRGRFDSRSKIPRLRCPLLFFHGDRDEIVPIAVGRRLFEAAPEPKTFETIFGAGHNDTIWVGGEPYFDRIEQFLDVVARP
jgi:pimeloyl-ACP methyl ester carboxylesterase